MTNYVEIKIEDIDSALKDILVARLSELNFEGFEELDNSLKAYISVSEFEEARLTELFDAYNVSFSKTILPQQNWNALWESNFDPVRVDDFCEVRANFHSPSKLTKYEITITPKMSFGTGHHATTYMMIDQMRYLDFKKKRIADFGTGTGILAILSEKLGGAEVIAIDNDEWSILNAEENLMANDCKNVYLFNADSLHGDKKFDIILANINKNVIFKNLDTLVNCLNKNGVILISGVLKEDENDVLKAFSLHNLTCTITNERNNWISMLFSMPGERSC